MTEFRDDEKHLSQIPALHLLQSLGFRMLARADTEIERAERRSNVFLEGILRERLHALNRIRFRGREHRFSEANVDTAIERLKSARSTGLQKSNEAVTDLLQLGTSLDQTIDGETRGFQLRYVDWEDWRSNAFHVSAEFDVEKARSTEARRPDIVLFVNGIPFAVIECKGPREDPEQAVSQMLRNQREDEIAALFHSVQLVIATNKNEVKYGTVGTASKFWSRWREREDAAADVEAVVKGRLDDRQMAATFSGGFAEDRRAYEAMLAEGGGRSVAEQDRVLYALCRPERLLDLELRRQRRHVALQEHPRDQASAELLEVQPVLVLEHPPQRLALLAEDDVADVERVGPDAPRDVELEVGGEAHGVRVGIAGADPDRAQPVKRVHPRDADEQRVARLIVHVAAPTTDIDGDVLQPGTDGVGADEHVVKQRVRDRVVEGDALDHDAVGPQHGLDPDPFAGIDHDIGHAVGFHVRARDQGRQAGALEDHSPAGDTLDRAAEQEKAAFAPSILDVQAVDAAL
jgi:hypothetical protein